MIAVFVDGPKSGAVANVADGTQSIGPVEGWIYTNTGGRDEQGRTIFRGFPQTSTGGNGSPEALIVDDPAPLNPFRHFPFVIDEFPAPALLGATPFANVTPAEDPTDGPRNPNQKERR